MVNKFKIPIPKTNNKSVEDNVVKLRRFCKIGTYKALINKVILNPRENNKYLFENKFIFQIGFFKFFKEKAKKMESIDSTANIIVLNSSRGYL